MTIEDVFGLFECVVSGASRTGLDLVESRGEVCGGLGLGANGVEVGSGCVLALGEGDELVAGALDDSERNEVGHCRYRLVSCIEQCVHSRVMTDL